MIPALGKAFAVARKNMGLTQSDLAKRLGKNRRDIWSIENRSSRNIGVDTAIAICDALGVDLYDLLGRERKSDEFPIPECILKGSKTCPRCGAVNPDIRDHRKHLVACLSYDVIDDPTRDVSKSVREKLGPELLDDLIVHLAKEVAEAARRDCKRITR